MRRCLLFLILAFAVGLPRSSRAYSLQTHEQLIDLAWDTSIVPLLLSRYPNLTPAQLEQARAYAYGGCVIQDIGYYPLGDEFFSDLTHYVRTGDFVVNLFRNANNANELAFAVGALSHYIGDSVGHSQATNLAVPIEFPKLGQKYGPVVNYAEAEHAHVQTEFAFDINEIAHRRFAPIHYLRHIGIRVSLSQLSLAFYQTYGLREDFSDTRHGRINVDGYDYATRTFIPGVAYAVTLLHRKHEPTDTADPDFQRFQTEIAAVAQKNNWDAYRTKPGIGTYTLAGLIFITPKFGPLKLAAVKGPTQATEIEYIHSVVRSTDLLNATLQHFTPPSAHPATTPPTPGAATESQTIQTASGETTVAPAPSPGQDPHRLISSRPILVLALTSDPRHPLINRDLDTGAPVVPAGYRLTDDTYANLVHQLVQHPTQPIPPGVHRDVLAYYADLTLPFATKKDPARWATLQQDLATFQTIPTSSEPDPFPTYGDATTPATTQ
jgi:Zinc dependent phospholipase C